MLWWPWSPCAAPPCRRWSRPNSTTRRLGPGQVSGLLAPYSAPSSCWAPGTALGGRKSLCSSLALPSRARRHHTRRLAAPADLRLVTSHPTDKPADVLRVGCDEGDVRPCSESAVLSKLLLRHMALGTASDLVTRGGAGALPAAGLLAFV